MLFLSLQTTSLEGNLSIEYNSPSLNAFLLPILYHPDLKEVTTDEEEFRHWEGIEEDWEEFNRKEKSEKGK